jgi:tetratricopeptide (TPR) repeat protein
MSAPLIDKRQWVRHNQEPFCEGSPAPEDPRPEMVRLLQEGRAAEVIARFDPADPRSLLALTNAYLQLGELDRAETMARRSIAHFHEIGHAPDEATAIALLARILWRTQGLEPAVEALGEAIAVDPLCKTAICNRLCYVSVSRRPDLLAEYVEDFLNRVPSWYEDDFYLQFFRMDSQLTWARQQATFAPILEYAYTSN